MIGKLKGWAILAGSVQAASWAASASAQDGGMPMIEPPAAVAPSKPAQDCDCGDRGGLSRHRHHRLVCAKRTLQDKFLGYPEEFHVWPLGASVRAHGQAMVDNGNVARMTFYQYDFVDGSAELKLRGRDKLAEVSRMLPCNFAPVVIERTPKTPGLDERRRLALLGQLAGGTFPVPGERIIVGVPMANGMMGNEAIIIDNNRYGALGSGNALGAGGGTAAGAGRSGFDSSGLSGPTGR